MAHVYEDNDPIRITATPSQTGTVHRCNPLGITKGVVVTWNAGPTYDADYKMAYFGDNFDLLEPYTP